MKKKTLIMIVIAAAVTIGFGVWAITPYFTTIDEPLPTSLMLPNIIEKESIIMAAL